MAAAAVAALPQSLTQSFMSDIADDAMADALEQFESGCLETTPDPPAVSSNENESKGTPAAVASTPAQEPPAKAHSAIEQKAAEASDSGSAPMQIETMAASNEQAPDDEGSVSIPPPPGPPPQPPPPQPSDSPPSDSPPSDSSPSPPPPTARGSHAPASGGRRKPNIPDYSGVTGPEALTAARRCNAVDASLLRNVCRLKGKDWIDELRSAESWAIVHLVAASKGPVAGELLKWLYTKGVKLNVITDQPGGLRPLLPYRSTALHFAVAFNAKECGRFLVGVGDASFLRWKNGADQTARDMNRVAERRAATDREEWEAIFAEREAVLELEEQSRAIKEVEEEEEEEQAEPNEDDDEDAAPLPNAEETKAEPRRRSSSTTAADAFGDADSGIATTITMGSSDSGTSSSKSSGSSKSSSSRSHDTSFPRWAMADYIQKLSRHLIPQTAPVATPSELFTDTPNYSVARPFAFCLALPVGHEDVQLQTSLSYTERMRPPIPCFTFSVLHDGNCWVISLLLSDAAPRNSAIAALAERWCQLRMSPIKGGLVHKDDQGKEQEIINEYRKL